jgi:hypothetical protein
MNRAIEKVASDGDPYPHRRFSRKRLVLAFAIAALSDAVSIFLTLTPPLQWILDLATAIVLFALLGWQWFLLPGLILEAIPGLSIMPFWVLVVAGVALWGTARPELKSLFTRNQ